MQTGYDEIAMQNAGLYESAILEDGKFVSQNSSSLDNYNVLLNVDDKEGPTAGDGYRAA